MPSNEKFLNQTGLAYYHDRAKTIFANKEDLEALEDRVDEIVAEGGEPNVIEKVKVNGTELIPDANKAVDIDLREYPSVSFNTSNGTLSITENLSRAENQIEFIPTENGMQYSNEYESRNLASIDYVDNNAGKIDKIKVNGTEQTITNKEVDIAVPVVEFIPGDDKVSISNDINGIDFQQNGQNIDYTYNSATTTLASKDYVDGKGSIAIDSSLNNKTTFTNGTSTSSIATSPDGIIYTEGATATEVPSKAYVDDAIADITGMEFVIVSTLPTEGQKGKIYLVSNESAGSNVYDEYIWVQDSANGRFEKIGSTDVDLSDYYNNTNLVAITTAEIDELFA